MIDYDALVDEYIKETENDWELLTDTISGMKIWKNKKTGEIKMVTGEI